VIDKVREKRVREDVMKILDQKENEYLPQIVLDTTEVRLFVYRCHIAVLYLNVKTYRRIYFWYS